LFLPDVASTSGVEAVYRDDAIPTKFARNGMPVSSSSQPGMMAEMLELLALEPGMRVPRDRRRHGLQRRAPLAPRRAGRPRRHGRRRSRPRARRAAGGA
jgi:hypothetical protein